MACADRHTAAPPRELQRIADEVLEYLQQPVAIRPDVRKVLREFGPKLDGARKGERSLGVHRIRDDPSRWYAARLDGEAAGVDASHVQQVLDQAVHPVRSSLDHLAGFPSGELRGFLAPEQGGLHQDRAEGIAEVMRHDPQDVVPDLDALCASR